MPQYTPSTRIVGSSLLIRGEPRKEVAAKRYLWRDILKMRREQAAHSVKTNHASQRVTVTNANANPVAN